MRISPLTFRGDRLTVVDSVSSAINFLLGYPSVRAHAPFGGDEKFSRLLGIERWQSLALELWSGLAVPCIGGVCDWVDAVDDNLLPAAQNFNFVRATVRRRENRCGELVE